MFPQVHIIQINLTVMVIGQHLYKISQLWPWGLWVNQNDSINTLELLSSQIQSPTGLGAQVILQWPYHEPQSSTQPPCMVSLTTQQMEGTNYIYSFEIFHADMHAAEWTKVINQIANLDINICRIPDLQTECKYFFFLVCTI